MSKVLALTVYMSGRMLRQYGFDQDKIRIGRDPNCDVCLPIPEVSRVHLNIARHHDHFELVDSGSANGTLVNGIRVSSKVLEEDDAIQVGVFRIVVKVLSSKADRVLATPVESDNRNLPTIKKERHVGTEQPRQRGAKAPPHDGPW